MGFGKDGKGVIGNHHDVATLGGALAAATAQSLFSQSWGEDFRLIKLEGYCGISGLAAGEAAVIYVADHELTVGEIAECLSAFPIDRNDNVPNERAHRPVFPLGMAFGLASSGMALVHFDKTIRWTFSAAEGWHLGVYNPDQGSAHAGALTYALSLKAFGVWVV